MRNMACGLLLGAWIGAGCAGQLELEEAVLQRTGATPCADDAECVISHNDCQPVGACSHTLDVPVTPDIVCDPPAYATPDASACVCGGAATCVVQ